MDPTDGFPTLSLGRTTCGNIDLSHRHEWLVTNGIGGYASGTVAGLNTRRYHGILVAALRPPVGRTVLVSKLDATVTYRGESYPLFCNEFGDGTIEPRGYQHIETFELEGLIPVWRYSFSDALLEIRLWMAHGRNTTYVTYAHTRGAAPMELAISPLCTYRDFHGHSHGGWELGTRSISDGVEINAFDGAQSFRVVAEGTEFVERRDWYWQFKHRLETYRGLDDTEDLFLPGEFETRLDEGDSITLTCSAEDGKPASGKVALAKEREREKALLQGCPEDDLVHRRLMLAADQFVVRRSRGRSAGATVIAGYPWFGDWGRDTMIALPGLTLATGRESVAEEILRTFSEYVSEGMLPNRFPEAGEQPEYNTADATLWYFVAVYEHSLSTGSIGLAKELFPVLVEIIDAHRRGTRYRIHVDPADELLYAGEPGVQITWMDAKVGDWVVTPRMGKPVEVNALWYNALRMMAEFARRLNKRKLAREYEAAAGRVRSSFEKRFWYEKGGYLYDVVDGPDDDTSLRPNQIFALSLPFPLLGGDKARSVLDACGRELYTPHGLRTLAPSDTNYVAVYVGGPHQRDGAYHQGTAWPWLLGPFASAHYKVYGDAELALSFLSSISAHLLDAGMGSISEIFDGAPPQQARGCYAQAWSVAEVLRAWVALTT
jgi:predicted glycogen debranching enzyme